MRCSCKHLQDYNYAWSPNYNISTTNTQQVIINPTVDTAYTLIAEKTPGCFSYDTVHVSVRSSPKIDLGSDQSFCTGDSLVLDAGTSFTLYQWSNGNTTQKIAAMQKVLILLLASQQKDVSRLIL
jgi:hypothetical protein